MSDPVMSDPDQTIPAADAVPDAEEQIPGAPAPVRRQKPPAGVPVWRTGRPDAVLAAAVDAARAGVETIAEPAQVGTHVAAKSEGDRLVTHLFESKLPGYGGWLWFATVTRLARSKAVTVSEVGLLPSEKSLLAPEWVPWAERVRPEDEQQATDQDQPQAEDQDQPQDATSEEGAGADNTEAGEPSGSGEDE
ncbi:DUF3027 domain-containing protein [Paenarthrobacter sp. DKR-5]|uniref:DUF3027 domain-containing protein n=1 Tax=Paenarthrobacter sp. DKR-5 TaxID=2835535 RepID=UPI002028E104